MPLTKWKSHNKVGDDELMGREERDMSTANLGDVPPVFGLNTCCPLLSDVNHPQNFPIGPK